MIIFGTRRGERPVESGSFQCPICETTRAYRRTIGRSWFTLYFLPVFPISGKQDQAECQGCFHRFDGPAVSERLGGRPLGVGPDGGQRFGPDGGQHDPFSVAPGSASLSAGGASLSAVADVSRPVAIPQVSGLAVASLVAAIFSPFLILACGMSLISSVVAIVTGHMAVAAVARSGGVLRGTGMARCGLAGGYLFALLSLAFIGWIAYAFQNADRGMPVADADPVEAALDAAAAERLRDAESLVMSAGSGIAYGNTDQAKAIAAEFATLMRERREELFTGAEPRGLSLTQGHFVTYCQVESDRCALIVHVPSYRHFDQDAKVTLDALARVTAEEVVRGHLPPGTSLALGLRGVLRYGFISFGRVRAIGDDSESGMTVFGGDRNDLANFFRTPVATDRPPAELPADGISETSPEMLVDDASDPRPGAEPDVPTPSVARVALEPPAGRASAHEDPFAGGQPATPGRLDPDEVATADPFAATAPRGGRPVLGRGSGGSSRPDRDPDPVVESPPADLLGQFPDLGWAVKSLAFSPDGQLLAAGKQDQTVLVLDLRSFRVADRRDGLRQIDQVTGVAFSNDGRRLIATGSRGNHVSWAIDGGGRLGPATDLVPSADGVQSLAASPAAGFVAIGGSRGEVLWQSLAASRSPAKRLAALEKPVLAIHLPGSGYSALASDGFSLLRFDLRRAAVTDQTSLGRGSAMAAAFSPEGERIAICAGAEVRIFQTDRGQLEQTLSAAREIQWSAAFLPGGKRLVTGGRGQATLWDLESGAPLQRFDLGGILYIQTLAISADGTRLAAVPAAAGQTLSVFRLESGE